VAFWSGLDFGNIDFGNEVLSVVLRELGFVSKNGQISDPL
jgi:hypothetical protein